MDVDAKGGVGLISKDAIIKDVVDKYPESLKIFAKHGLHCIGWGGALFESIEQGAQVHGVNIDKLMDDLNKLDASNKK